MPLKSRAIPASVVKLAPIAILVVGGAVVYSRRSAALRRLPVFELARSLSDGPETPVIIGSFTLGRVQGRTITCHVQQTGGTVALLFMIRDARGNKSVLTFEGGSGVELEVKVADFIGSGRRQVFLNIRHQRSSICVLDCDGTQIRTIYRNDRSDESGAINPCNVRLMRSKSDPKLWTLEEEQRREGWVDTGSQGLFYELLDYDSPPAQGEVCGHVVRFLHGNGKEFVPDNPGPTRLVPLTVKEFERRFHH